MMRFLKFRTFFFESNTLLAYGLLAFFITTYKYSISCPTFASDITFYLLLVWPLCASSFCASIFWAGGLHLSPQFLLCNSPFPFLLWQSLLSLLISLAIEVLMTSPVDEQRMPITISYKQHLLPAMYLLKLSFHRPSTTNHESCPNFCLSYFVLSVQQT